MSQFVKAQIRLAAVIRDGLTRREDQRGDVPGWVLITIMTAGLVAVIWGVAEGKLAELFNEAMDNVGPSGN